MKAKITIEIDFDSWFSDGKIPKTKESWAEFFYNFYMPDSQVIGIDEGEGEQEMICLNTNEIIELEITD